MTSHSQDPITNIIDRDSFDELFEKVCVEGSSPLAHLRGPTDAELAAIAAEEAEAQEVRDDT